jgi:cytochrome c oxidase cbb3-type subunit 2
MKNGPCFFLCLFGALAFSWGGLALASHRQLGGLAPYYDAAEGKAFPEPMTGVAARGQLVYQDLGCASCHTQQVRRADFGNDIDRKWGTRQSWARDYIYQNRVQLGSVRVGPDLANVGARLKSAQDVYRLLALGAQSMPSYRFLFEESPAGAATGAIAVATVQADGRNVVPTRRAMDLAAYLLSLNGQHAYGPETAHNTIKPAEGHKAAEESKK